MPGCRQGDLAVVIRGENSGTFVKVLRSVPTPRFSGVAWECHASAPVRASVYFMVTGQFVENVEVPPGMPVCFYDRDLDPIRPAPEQATLPDRELVYEEG